MKRVDAYLSSLGYCSRSEVKKFWNKMKFYFLKIGYLIQALK